MAAITPDATDASTVMSGSFAGADGPLAIGAFQHVRLPFITQTVGSSDTYTPGGEVSVAMAAWEPVDVTDLVSAVPNGTSVTLVGAGGGGHAGYLHLWLTK